MLNRLLSGAISRYLVERGELMPISIGDCSNLEEPYLSSKSHNADIVLMEVARIPPFTLEERLVAANRINNALPNCKIVILCDEKADPELAEAVKDAKKQGLINSFFYSSVSGEYLSAMLDAL